MRLTPMVVLLKRLSYCSSHVLHHSYCFHPDIMKLSCTDTRINSAVGLTALISTAGVDSVFIILSYVLIIRTVLSIASPEERKKAFSTCISHIGAVAVFYIPLISLSFVHRFGKRAPPYVHTLLSLCNCPVREQPDSLRHYHPAQPPRAHVLLPLHAIHH